jgi:galactose oxidase-like protein
VITGIWNGRLSLVGRTLIGLAMALLLPACVNERPLLYSGGVGPRTAEALQSTDAIDNPDVAVALPTAGDVLIAGGAGGMRKSLNTAEFYDPTTGKFTSTGKMASTRVGFGAVAFAGGTLNHQVVVAGGASGRAKILGHTLRLAATALDNAEVYDPTTGKFIATAGTMVAGRAFFATTPLNDGTVLITGGIDSLGTPLNTAEIFDPVTGTFTATTGTMSAGRAFHTATLLNDGTVLVAFGLTASMQVSSTAEIYHPTTGLFSLTTGTAGSATAGQTATLITGCSCSADGRVAIAGGFSVSSGSAFSGIAIQLYDPATQSFSIDATLIESRVFQTATLLTGGKVLLAGGLSGFVKVSNNGVTALPGGGALNTAEIFDPSADTETCVNGMGAFRCNASMVNARGGHTATMFTSGPLAGQILMAGGVGGVKSLRGTPHPLSSAELYNPATGATGAFTGTGKMHAARVMQQAALLQ